MFDEDDMVSEAIWLLRNCLPSVGTYHGAFSGGKDSIALHHIAKLAKVPVEWHYHITTIDPPEVYRFIKKEYPHVIRDRPKQGNLFARVIRKGVLPSPKIRWCCSEYKEERGPLDATWLVGVRREESRAREQLPAVEIHRGTRRLHVRPLINWSASDVWHLIHAEHLAYPSLYDEGFHRLGCIGCPLASAAHRRRELARWPFYAKRWEHVVRAVWQRHNRGYRDSDKPRKATGMALSFDEFYNAWLTGASLPSGMRLTNR